MEALNDMMYKIKIINNNNETKIYNHINKVCVMHNDKIQHILEGESIYNYEFESPYNLQLYSGNEKYIINESNPAIIYIIKEKTP